MNIMMGYYRMKWQWLIKVMLWQFFYYYVVGGILVRILIELDWLLLLLLLLLAGRDLSNTTTQQTIIYYLCYYTIFIISKAIIHKDKYVHAIKWIDIPRVLSAFQNAANFINSTGPINSSIHELHLNGE
jgi:hypothetical protein